MVRLVLLVQLVWCCALAPVRGEGQVSGDLYEHDKLTFGVYAHVRSTELLKKLTPILRYIEASMAKKGVARRIEMRIYPTYGDAIDALADGQVDFARYGPVSYVLAKNKNAAIRLLAMESNHGKKRFNGVIFVPQHSEIQSVVQLRGRHFAFGSRMSTTGCHLVQAELVKAGIKAPDLADFSYLGRHDKVAFAVAAGKFDAGAMNENTFAEYAESKGLRKILEFPCVTKPWTAREGLPDDVFFTLQAALMELDDPATLGAIKRTGFLPAADSDYDPIRKGMALAREFELLTLRFGTYASESPSTIYAKIRSVLNELEEMAAGRGMPVRFEMNIYPTYAQATAALINGKVDLARLGAASYLLAKRKNSGVYGLVSEDNAGRPAAMVIVVRDASELRAISDLTGRSFAFGDPESTEGRYFAQSELVRAGIHASDLDRFDYLGRYDRIAVAVIRGKYDAGALRDAAFAQYGASRGLRAICRVPVPHKTWVVREGFDPDLSESLRSWLLAMRDPDVLSDIQRFGFKQIDETGFESMNRAMENAGRFQAPR